MTKPKKLYRLTSKGFEYPWAVWKGTITFSPGGYIPQLFWPDGTVCWLANLYLVNGYKKGKSRKNKGGTLLTWAKNLSFFIRWCYRRKIDFFALGDLDFVAFISHLKDETVTNAPDKKARSHGQVLTIAGTVMNFLAFIDTIMPGLGLIGAEAKVKAELVPVEVKKGGKTFIVKKWTHTCLPKAKPTRRRQPISTIGVEKLYDANNDSNDSAYIKRRRFIMLRTFEVTGGRRIEASFVKINDLKMAEKTGMLRIHNAKQQDDESERYVPVTKADLKEILSFVKHYRNVVIKKTIGVANDHGYLFINSKNGEPLEVDTLSAELYAIRIAAGIDDEEACLHAFRHRYITNELRRLIRTHRCDSVSDLKKALLSTETLKQQLMEWTGQRNVESLNRYIHLAFELEADFKHSVDILKAGKVVESLSFIVKDYRHQAQTGGWTPQLFKEFDNVVAAAELELSQLLAGQLAVEAQAVEVSVS
jgi:integrase